MFTFTPAPLFPDHCQGHGGDAECDQFDQDYGHLCGEDFSHGVTSFCDGSCDSARDYFARCARNGHDQAPVSTVDTIAIEFHNCVTDGRHIARFEGQGADERAAAYLAARRSTHAIAPVEAEPFDAEAFPLTAQALWPTCDHGLSLMNCYGPGHYMSNEQERLLDIA